MVEKYLRESSDLRLGKPLFTMADVSTPSAAAVSLIDAGSGRPEKQQKGRPEKPDEQLYRENLAKAEREHAVAQEKLVRSSSHNSRLHGHPIASK